MVKCNLEHTLHQACGLAEAYYPLQLQHDSHSKHLLQLTT